MVLFMTTTMVLNAIKNEKCYTAESLLGHMGIVVNRDSMRTIRGILLALRSERRINSRTPGSGEIVYFKK